ncbi:Protein CBR-COL-87 [Caenorhabditis briggsae]|uniref:Protein CBR-COL-87 n=1 Tax=Caenorhabditis briggsae TaxID=6238 RepID=A8XYR4_CAEBR|nr:Protein CBR-COL-87 [Caenorhabditis briggsae]CAP37780.2 Protein CBR-COL-87 [Caenorhabditis briggsae]
MHSSYSYFHPLSYFSTLFLLTSLSFLVYFVTDVQKFEEECKSQMIVFQVGNSRMYILNFDFQTFEQAAWKDIIQLEKLHARARRDVGFLTKRKTRRRQKVKKHKRPVQIIQQEFVPVAEEVDEYKNSDWRKESEDESTDVETSTEVYIEEKEDVQGSSPFSENSDENETENNGYSAPKNPTNPEKIRNMERREMKLKNGYTKKGLETDNGEEGEKKEEDVEGYEEREDNEDEECADTDLKCYGNPCPRGPAGPPGPHGSPGEDAPDGVDGGNGTDWELLVEDRVIVLGCVKCPQGPRGVEGDPGPPGDKGGTGKNGNPGLDGYEGFPGQSGQEGEAGYDGDYGPDGWAGQRGEDSKIYKNLPGPPGPSGAAGPPGEVGGYGNLGYGGIEGVAGVAGAPGEHGIPGPPGAPGTPGEPGIPGEYVGQCKCPERRRSVVNSYPQPPPSYYTVPYSMTTEAYLTSSDYPVYVETTTQEVPTTSIYRYFVKAATPGYKTMETTSEYVETTTVEYSTEAKSQYVEDTSTHIAEASKAFEPPEDHPRIPKS